ncbi:hypothetical protein [Pantoea sp. 18069]|uniref:hypothetical protein n=1 Tax=Pantoea sp. 18069 TaxID=2681415 RepID=UPI00135C541D|nr:hypothetical protein [Pantoea sp. 18069]
MTNNSNVVTGTGTSWVDAAALGETFLGPDGQSYEITSIVSGVSLRISPNYKGSTASAQSYAIMPTQGYLRDLAAQAAALVASYQAVRDGAGAGKFPAGAALAPSLRAAADENTGINLPGNDILQLVTGGVVRLQIAADGTPTGVMVEKLPISVAAQTALNSLAAACIALNMVGAGPDQVPAVQQLGGLAFMDQLGVLTPMQSHPAESRSVWTEFVSNTSLKLCMRGDDGVVRSTTWTMG